MLSICLCIIIRLCESSRHPTKGKHHFYICQNGSLKFCRINGENPDNIGVFTGYIYFVALLWLGNRDSNPNKQSQSLSCYRYTIPQYQTPKQILSHLRVNIIHTLLRSVNLFSKKIACG